MFIVMSFPVRKVWSRHPSSIFKLFLPIGKFTYKASSSYYYMTLMEEFKCIYKITVIISNLQIKKLRQSSDLMSTKFSMKTLLG